MTEEKLEKIDKQKLPLLYRLILKLPNMRVESLPHVIQGLFWGIVLPLLIGVEVLVSFFLLFLPPPANLIALTIIPAAILIIFVKTMLQRFINWWNGFVSSQTYKWNVTQALDEYKDLLEKQNAKNKEHDPTQQQ